MTVALVGRSSRKLWHKGSLHVLSRVNIHHYIYLVTFGYGFVLSYYYLSLCSSLVILWFYVLFVLSL